MFELKPPAASLAFISQGDAVAQVARERVDLLFKGSRMAMLTGLPGPALVAWLFQPFVGTAQSWGFAALIYSYQLLSAAYFWMFYQQRGKAGFNASLWMRRETLRMGVLGSLLGLWMLASSTSGSDTAIFYALSLAAIICAASLTQFGVHAPVIWAFTTPFLLGSAAQMLWLWGHTGNKLGLVSAIYLTVFWAVIIAASKRFSKVLLRDLSLRLRNEALLTELSVQKEKAEAASEAKSRFLAAASHDLRQPVHAVALLADALQDRSQDPHQKALLARLQGGVAHFSDVVDEVLDVARLDAGAVHVQWQAVFVQDLLDRLEATYRELAQAKGLALLIRPCVQADAAIWSDPSLLWRVLSNLLGNAVRYTATGSILIAVRADSSLGQRAWRFEVRDSGPGIAKEHQKLIFEEFYQLHNPQRDAKSGIGLGLAMAERMAKLLGSRVKLRSCENQGATFSIAVSAYSTGIIQRKGIENMAKNTLPALSAFDWQLLVIDDDESSREAMHLLLQSWGLKVQAVANLMSAQKAVQGLPKTRRLILLTDHWLANGEDAFAAVARVQSFWQQQTISGSALSVAVLTGDIRAELRQQIQSQGWFFSPKPARPLALRMWLESIAKTDALEPTKELP